MKTKDRIRDLRVQSGLTRKRLSVVLNVSENTVRYWEEGKTYPGSEYIIALSEFFNVSSDYLLGISDKFSSAKSDYETFALFQKFMKLDDYGMDTVKAVVETELNRVMREENDLLFSDFVDVPTFTTSVTDRSLTPLKKKRYIDQAPDFKSIPSNADFRILVYAEGEEPSMLYVKKSPIPEQNGKGVFIYKDDLYCGEYVQIDGEIIIKDDISGREDLCIPRSDTRQFKQIGIIVTS